MLMNPYTNQIHIRVPVTLSLTTAYV